MSKHVEHFEEGNAFITINKNGKIPKLSLTKCLKITRPTNFCVYRTYTMRQSYKPHGFTLGEM